jgi:hypothetical protein
MEEEIIVSSCYNEIFNCDTKFLFDNEQKFLCDKIVL